MAKSGRAAGFTMGPEHRDKIKNSNILRRVIKFAEGNPDPGYEYQHAQVGLGLLKKILPDLSAVELSGDEDAPVAVTSIERVIVKPADKDA